MTFREWQEGQPFEMQVGGQTRFGVKLAPGWEKENGKFFEIRFRALMFDSMKIEAIAHNKQVDAMRQAGGRLARTHDNRLIVVNEVRRGVFAGYYVNFTAYQNLQKSEITFIQAKAGERAGEVDIIMDKLHNLREKESILLKSLEIFLEDAK
jgi:Holliday junction resolvase-like predicted endonuclease